MQILPFFSTLCGAFALANAAECTERQLQTAGWRPEIQNARSICWEFYSDAGIKPDMERLREVCKNQKCLDALKDASRVFPKCEVGGVNVSATYENTMVSCQSIIGANGNGNNATSTSSSSGSRVPSSVSDSVATAMPSTVPVSHAHSQLSAAAASVCVGVAGVAMVLTLTQR